MLQIYLSKEISNQIDPSVPFRCILKADKSFPRKIYGRLGFIDSMNSLNMGLYSNDNAPGKNENTLLEKFIHSKKVFEAN